MFNLRILIIALCLSLPVETAADPNARAIGKGLAASFVIYSDDPEEAFLGSGFIWEDGGLGVTNAHVVGPEDYVVVVYSDGTRERSRVIARAPKRDVALLRLNRRAPGLTPDTGPLPVGTPVVALGAPMGLGFTATRGIVSAAPRQVEGAVPLKLIQHDAALNPGSSGGALIGVGGRLVGMNSQIADGSRLFIGISYAISASDLVRIVEALLEARLKPLPQLGLDLRPVDRRIALALGIEVAGVLVDHVAPGSVAERGGLKSGDVITSLNGNPVHQPGDLAFLLEAAGDDVTLCLRRGDEVRYVRLPLPAPFAREPVLSRLASAPDFTEITLGALSVVVDDQGRVSELVPDSAPARHGLAVGDRILALNGQTLTAEDLLVAKVATPLVLLIERDGHTRHVIVDPWSTRPVLRPLGGGNSLDLSVVRF